MPNLQPGSGRGGGRATHGEVEQPPSVFKKPAKKNAAKANSAYRLASDEEHYAN